jgi:hypothetical protein
MPAASIVLIAIAMSLAIMGTQYASAFVNIISPIKIQSPWDRETIHEGLKNDKREQETQKMLF